MIKTRKFLTIGLVAATLAAGAAAATPASAFSCLTGAAIGVAAIGPIVAGAAQQKVCGYPAAQPIRRSPSTPHARKGRTCTQTEWDALQGYVQSRVPCQ
jgi:hypothetical protein